VHEKIRYVQSTPNDEHVLIIPGAKTERIDAERSRIYSIRSPLLSRTSRYRALLNLRAIEEILERERPDLIESGDPYQVAWKAISSGRALRLPAVGFYHSHFPEAYLRTTARFLAFGVNGLSVALLVVVFAHTAGVSGAEVGIAGGSAVVGQKLLEAVFGDQAVRRLAATARQDLYERVSALMDEERTRYLEVLDGLGIDEGDVDSLRAVSRRVDDLRFRDSGRLFDAAVAESEDA